MKSSISYQSYLISAESFQRKKTGIFSATKVSRPPRSTGPVPPRFDAHSLLYVFSWIYEYSGLGIGTNGTNRLLDIPLRNT
jgi:hypothetical protein